MTRVWALIIFSVFSERGSWSHKPRQLHLELGLVQFRLDLFPLSLVLRPAAAEKLRQPLHQMVPLLWDLVGTGAELARDPSICRGPVSIS